jgi:hypothetical protein
MEKFMRKYSFVLTSALGIAAVIILIVTWNTLPMITKLPLMYIVALAIHEIEELKIPGGFVELVTSMTGVEIKNIGVAKFGLFVFTLWATIVPALTSNLVWTVMSTMLIGIIEIFAHLAAARINKDRFYSPGMITAVFVQFPLAVYGFYYMISNHMVQGIYWLYAALFLLIPLFGLQAAIVKSNGQKYSEFMNNARKALFSKKES